MQNEQEFAGRTVGSVDCETPSALVGLGTYRSAVTRNNALIVGSPRFGPSGCHAAGTLRLDELDPSGIGETFFCRIDDLDHMTMGTSG